MTGKTDGHDERHRGVPDLTAGEALAGAGGAAGLRQPARARPAPRTGRVARRRERRLLQAAGARQRHRRLRRACSRRWPAPSSSTTPSAPTSTTRPRGQPGAPGPAVRRSSASARSCSASSTQMGAPAIVRNTRVDYLAANRLGRALYAPLFESREQPANSARFTFLDPAAATSTPTGSASPATSSRTCAPRPAATPMTAACRTSSASCRPAATSSARGGPRTTSASTRPAPSACTTRRRRARSSATRTMELSADEASARLQRRARQPLPAGAGPPGQLDGDARPTQPTSPRDLTHGDHPQQHRHRKGPGRLVHRRRLHRRRRRPAGTSTCAAALVHFTPARAPRGTRTRSARRSSSPRASGSASARAARSRSSAPATASSSSPARTTGTARRPNRFMVHIAINEVDDRAARRHLGRPRHRRASTRAAPTLDEEPAWSYRPLGRTGVSVSKLCLGAMMFGAWGNPDHDDSIRIIHRALDAGHQLHRHRRRLLAGRVGGDRRQGAGRGRRDDVVLATKVHRADGRRPEPARQLAPLDHPARSRTRCGGWAPTGSTSTRSTAPTRTPTSRRRSARSPTSSARARSATSAPRPSRASRSSRRSGSARDRQPAALTSASSRRTRCSSAGSRPTSCRPAQRYGMGVIPWSPLAGGWLSGRWRKGADAAATRRAPSGSRTRYDLSLPGNQRKLDAADAARAARRARPGMPLDRARHRVRRSTTRPSRRRSSGRAPWSTSRASCLPPTSSWMRRCSTASTRSSRPGRTSTPPTPAGPTRASSRRRGGDSA